MTLRMALKLTVTFSDKFGAILDEIAENSGLHSRAEAARFLCGRGLEAMAPSRASFRMASHIEHLSAEEMLKLTQPNE